MNKEEYVIFPGQIKINNCTYFGLDFELTDFVNHLAEQNKKYKEVFNKAIEYIETHKRKDEFLELNEWGTRELLDILKEVE